MCHSRLFGGVIAYSGGQCLELRAVIAGDREWTARATSVHVFPDDLAVGLYLKKAPRIILGYECVAVGKPLLRTHGFAEEFKVGVPFSFVLPDDLLGNGVEFDDERLSTMSSVSGEKSIVEQDNISLFRYLLLFILSPPH